MEKKFFINALLDCMEVFVLHIKLFTEKYWKVDNIQELYLFKDVCGIYFTVQGVCLHKL